MKMVGHFHEMTGKCQVSECYHKYCGHNDLLILPQGIFGVGQSTAKFINKETNIQTKFA